KKKEDQQVVNLIARRFEQSLAKSDLWRNTQNAQNNEEKARHARVVSQILEEVRTSASDAYSRKWREDVSTPPDVNGGHPPDSGPHQGPPGDDGGQGGGGRDNPAGPSGRGGSGGSGGDSPPAGPPTAGGSNPKSPSPADAPPV